MSEREHLFTSESVSEGHPDKMADRNSDAVLDWLLERDPEARVACESLVAKNLIVVAGEFGSKRIPDLIRTLENEIPRIARAAARDIGYRGGDTGFDPDGCEVRLSLSEQSRDIDAGVTGAGGTGEGGAAIDASTSAPATAATDAAAAAGSPHPAILGAGDQGLMFGYACDETPELMPLPIALAHALVRRQAEVRRAGTLPWLRPDAKSQVTVRYRGTEPVAIETVVLSTQHAPSIDTATLRRAVEQEIILPCIPEALRSPALRLLVNPTGRFEIGGPDGDVGVTGRKIIVDTYGGSCPHGGGAFSGKDATKVDRSATYAARHVAKNIVAAGLARRCTVQLAYAIGVAEPVSVLVDTHGTGRTGSVASTGSARPAASAKGAVSTGFVASTASAAPLDDARLEEAVRRAFDLTPAGIIGALRLRRPIFGATAAYGHFGREDEGFGWEELDQVAALREAVDLPAVAVV